MKKVSEKNVTQEPLKKSELIAKQKELLELMSIMLYYNKLIILIQIIKKLQN